MEKEHTALIGIIVISISATIQITCLFLVRILAHMKRGKDPTTTLRSWFHMSAALDQISFIIFHVQYNFLQKHFDDADNCVLIRFLSSMTSSMTNMWLLVIASFYLMLTIKPAKCFTFHARFLSHCVTWTWTCVGSLMYLMMSHMLKEEYHGPVLIACWNKISNTIHMYLTYGNEIIPFVIAFIFIFCAKIRLRTGKFLVQTFSEHSEFKIQADHAKQSTNIVLLLFVLMSVYYISLMTKIQFSDKASDIVIMMIQAYKGFAIALVCFIYPDTLLLLRCKAVTEAKQRENSLSGSINSDKKNALEMQTYKFDT